MHTKLSIDFPIVVVALTISALTKRMDDKDYIIM